MKRLFLIFCLFILNQTQAIEVKGHLFDLDDHQGVSDAIVTAYSLDKVHKIFGITDSLGNFNLQFSYDWKEGEYPITVNRPDYYTLNGFILVKDHAIRDLYIKRKIDNSTKKVESSIEDEIKEQALAPTANLTFLIDISASMNQEGKIDTLKYALKHLIQLLKPTDRISIVTYSNFAKLYMDTKDGTHKKDITQAIDRITCYGFTNGGQGLDLAFKTAVKNYIKDGNNKVILVTDGIFTTTKNKEDKSMEKMVKQMYNKKIALSTFSFGDIEQEAKNYLLRLSKLGGGSYAHIQDTPTAKTVMKKEALSIGAFNSK